MRPAVPPAAAIHRRAKGAVGSICVGIGATMAPEMGRMTAEPLPGLTVAEGLTRRDLHRLRVAVLDGHSPRVRMLPCAGQVAGQRGAVVAVGRPGGDVVEFIHVRMDRDGDVLPFAPHELHLLAALPTERVAGGRRNSATALPRR